MKTKYTHTLLVAVPEQMLDVGNQLAQQIGENPEADANTFVNLTHENHEGVKYAIAYTVITDTAKLAVDNATFPQGILVALDIDMGVQLAIWGLHEANTDTTPSD